MTEFPVSNFILQKYRILTKLGSGSFADVYKVMDEKNNVFAMKVCRCENSCMRSILAEAILYEQSYDPNVIYCHEIIMDVNKLIFILEYADYNLTYLISKGHFRSDENLATCIDHIVRGLKYLTDTFGVTHCDLTPCNILYCSKDSRLKIADFNSMNVGKFSSTPGTSRWYCSPESMLEHKYTEKSDVWSIGCIMYEILTGNPLFNSDDEKHHVQLLIDKFGISKAEKNKKDYREDIEKYFTEIKSDDAREFLLKLLDLNPEERPTLEEILKDRFITRKVVLPETTAPKSTPADTPTDTPKVTPLSSPKFENNDDNKDGDN